MFKSGEFISEYITLQNGDDVPEKQVQPNGVELAIDKVEEVVGNSVIYDDDYQKGVRRLAKKTSDDNWFLSPGYYVVTYGEEIKIPENHLGYVVPRSRFMRSGMFLTSALWDAGYEGRGEGGLIVFQHSTVEEHMRIGQMVMAHCETNQQYEGTHQKENL